MRIEIREFNPKKEPAFAKRWADMLDYMSWGSPKDPYPKKAMEEIPHVLVAYGAFHGKKLVGAACVTDHHSSPDGQDRDAMYLALAVVDPKYRRRGIWEILYARRLEWVSGRPGRVITTCENRTMMLALFDRGWKPYRLRRAGTGD